MCCLFEYIYQAIFCDIIYTSALHFYEKWLYVDTLMTLWRFGPGQYVNICATV